MDGVRLKVKRAREHRETFERELFDFFSHEPERVTAEFDQDAGGYYLKLSEPIPDRWSCIIGDCAQNLRNAFDHFVWASALLRNANPNRRIAFPITRDEPAWNRYLATDAARSTKNAVSSAVWQFIVKMQPHSRPRPDAYADPLWGINELARIDRHQTVHLAVVQQQGTAFGFGPTKRRGNVLDWEASFPWARDPTEHWARFITPIIGDGASVGYWSLSDGEGEAIQIPAKSQVAFEILIDADSTWAPGTWISDMLTALVESVENHCLPGMEEVFGT